MKFLCVPCDSKMTLQTIAPPDGGSLSVVYSCPECGYEIAMLTNQFETQLVQSLGVRIGPATGASPGVGAPVPDARLSNHDETGGVAATSAGRCPFPAMMPAMEGALEGAGHATPAIQVRWTSSAEARLANIPAFVRPMARTGIEQFARERGAVEVDEEVLDAAREFFGM